MLATSVILSGAKNLGASKINMLRDSSSPAAPQNDIFGDFFSSLIVPTALSGYHNDHSTLLRPPAPEQPLSDLPLLP
jgi:hypothetical protein